MAKWKPGGPGRPPASAKKRVGRPRKNAAARALGKRGGAARTAKQNAARRSNSAKAGRPGKVCLFCGRPAKGGHKIKRYDTTCGMHGWTYRQRSLATDDSVLRNAVIAEIAALEKLLATLPPPELLSTATLPPQEEPKPEPAPEPEPEPKPAPPEPERRLDTTTLDWKVTELQPEPAEPGAVPF